MAREGINKQLVQQAKTALLAQGKRPTIEAVRIALGNTGSKTTISHYLKELEEKPKPTLERLSEPLAKLVFGLSEQLQAESEEQSIKAQAQFSLEKAQLESQLHRTQKQLEEQQDHKENLEARLLNEQQQRQEATAKVTKQTSDLVLAQQRIEELTRQLQEQHTQIAILNNERQHADEIFKQFRQVLQEEHDTLLRQHAQQVTQLSEELHHNFEKLSITQKELIELHRENARLLQQLSTRHSALGTRQKFNE